MALAANNITPRLANTEMGSPLGINDLTVKAVCGQTGQNQYSFYGPWNLGVNATTKCVEISYGTNNYKLGDFRSYNHSAAASAPATSFTHNWGPGGTTTNIGITSLFGPFNVLEANSGATYVTYNAYLTTTDRINETNRYDQDINVAQFNTISALTGHTRSQTQQIHGTHVDTFVGMLLTGLTTPNDFIYLDTFFSDVSGNRLVTLGATKAAGYTTITMHERQNPTLDGGANISPPSGWTVAFPIIHSASTPVCTDSILTQTNGDTTYDFYLCVRGVDGIVQRTRQVTSCTVSLKVGGSSATIATSQALGYTSKTRLTGTIPAGLSDGNFSYDEVWTVELSSITYGAGEGGPC